MKFQGRQRSFIYKDKEANTNNELVKKMGQEILMPQNAEIDSFIKDTHLDIWKQIWIKLQLQNPKEKKSS